MCFNQKKDCQYQLENSYDCKYLLDYHKQNRDNNLTFTHPFSVDFMINEIGYQSNASRETLRMAFIEFSRWQL